MLKGTKGAIQRHTDAKGGEIGEEGEKYIKSAINILRAMEENWCSWDKGDDSILQMGSLMYTSQVHIPIIYGDYFFVEAMLKLKGNDFLPW